MSHQSRILEFVEEYPGRDDDEIARLLHISPRQTVNKMCRILADKGMIARRANPQGKIGNYPLRAQENAFLMTSKSSAAIAVSPDTPTDWFWEGNVVATLASHLVAEGWTITAQADTASREQGPDLVAVKDGLTLHVEAKGYPSVGYRDPARAGERKPTNPTQQAQHWLSHALLKAMRLQGAHPDAQVALAFPDFPRYRGLLGEVEAGVAKLGLWVLFVGADGGVETCDFRTLPRT